MKTIKKASLLFASLALVLGAGLVGNSDTKEVKAEDEVYKTLDLSTSKNESVNSYTETWSAVVDGESYTIVNGNNFNATWLYTRFGQKKAASVGKIVSPKFTESVTKVILTIDKVTIANINSITLSSADSSTAADSDWTDLATFDIAQGNQAVTIATPAANKSYKITFDCKKGSNGSIQISKVQFYKEKVVIVKGADEIIKLIEAIGTVEYSDECKAKIDAARSAYKNASSEIQSQVTNLDVLEKAEKDYADIKETTDLEKSMEVDGLIDALPEVEALTDKTSKSSIDAAYKKYSELNDDQKNLVNEAKASKLKSLVQKVREFCINDITIEELLNKTANDNTVVRVRGTVTKITQAEYGNFILADLNDSSKTITVYGSTADRSMLYLDESESGAIQGTWSSGKNFNSACAVGDIVTMHVVFLMYNTTPEIQGVITKVETATDVFVAKVKAFDLCNASAEELKVMLDEYDALIAKNADAANSVVDETTTLAERMAYMQLVYNKKANTTGESTSGVVITSNNSYDKTSLIALFAILGIVTISGYYIIEKKKFSK